MKTVIFRTVTPSIVALMIVFSVFVCLRGHNQPGGGFIGGLIAASAIAIYGMAADVATVRGAMRFDPMTYAGFGVFLAGCSGLLSLLVPAAFMTGLWGDIHLGEAEITLSTPMFFDIGVYFVVFGTLSAVALALEGYGEVS